MDRCLLILIGTPAAEGALLDWLLSREEVPGFSSCPVAGHGTAHHRMSMAEQVEGRQKQVMFWIELPLPQARQLVEALKRELAGSVLHYWILPVIEGGQLG